MGIEPTASGTTNRCSTTELRSPYQEDQKSQGKIIIATKISRKEIFNFYSLFHPSLILKRA